MKHFVSKPMFNLTKIGSKTLFLQLFLNGLSPSYQYRQLILVQMLYSLYELLSITMQYTLMLKNGGELNQIKYMIIYFPSK